MAAISDQVEDLEDKLVEVESRNARLEKKILEAVDILVEYGKLENNPYSRRQWLES